MSTCLITGAAGFVGSHLADRLLERGVHVVGVDNMLLGQRSHLAKALHHPNFSFIEADVNDYEKCHAALSAHAIQTVWHLAANSDIRAGTTNPEVELRHTFLTTFSILKLMRALNIRQ